MQTTHFITVISYVVIGTGLMVPTIRLIRTPREVLHGWLGSFLNERGVTAVTEHRRIVEAHFLLFGIFIFACAVDHFTYDHQHLFKHWFVIYVAQFEAMISALTAMLFVASPLTFLARSRKFRDNR